MDLSPEPRFLAGFTPVAVPPAEMRSNRDAKAADAERRLAGWLYQSVPAFLGIVVLSWGALLNNITGHAHPLRMAAWSLLVLIAGGVIMLLWRSLRAGRPLATFGEWIDAHRSALWVLGFAWGAAAFLVIPHMAQPVPLLAWFLVPLGGLAMAVPCAADLRASLAVGLPPLLLTLASLAFKGMAVLSLALVGVGVLSAVAVWSAHRLIRVRAETAVRLGPAPVLFGRY